MITAASGSPGYGLWCFGWFGLVAGLVAGCSVGPDYEVPESSVNPAYVESEDPRIDSDTQVDVAWWNVFNDPVLVRLVETAYAQNLTLRGAGVRVLRAMAERGIAVGDFFPQSQTLDGSYSRARVGDNYAAAGGPKPPPDNFWSEWSVSANATWELDFWGRFRRALESADAGLDASLADYDSVMVSLIAEVALTYVSIRTYDERLAVVRENVASQEAGLEISREKYDAGAVSLVDVAQARSQVAQTRSAIPVLEAGRRQAVYALCTLLGEPPGRLEELLQGPGTIPDPPRNVAVGAPAEQLAAAQSALIGVAKADLYPSFFLAGSIGLQANQFNRLWRQDSWTGVINPGFSWPILNYGRIKNNVRVQDAAFQEAAVFYQNTVLQAAQDVDSSLAAYLGSLDQVKALEESVEAARQSANLAMEQYLAGASPYLLVLFAQETLLAVTESLAAARGSVAANLVTTYRALGGGWEVRDGLKDLVPEETREEMRERTDWGKHLDPEPGGGLTLIPPHDPDQVARPENKREGDAEK